jgi:hypothetical protein
MGDRGCDIGVVARGHVRGVGGFRWVCGKGRVFHDGESWVILIWVFWVLVWFLGVER